MKQKKLLLWSIETMESVQLPKFSLPKLWKTLRLETFCTKPHFYSLCKDIEEFLLWSGVEKLRTAELFYWYNNWAILWFQDFKCANIDFLLKLCACWASKCLKLSRLFMIKATYILIFLLMFFNLVREINALIYILIRLFNAWSTEIQGLWAIYFQLINISDALKIFFSPLPFIQIKKSLEEMT